MSHKLVPDGKCPTKTGILSESSIPGYASLIKNIIKSVQSTGSSSQYSIFLVLLVHGKTI